MNIAYLIIFLGFYAIVFIILIVVSLPIRRLRIPKRSKNIVLVMVSLLVFLVCNYLREPWYDSFKEGGFIMEVLTDEGTIASAHYKFSLVIKGDTIKIPAGKILTTQEYEEVTREEKLADLKKQFQGKNPILEIAVRDQLDRSYAVLPILILAYFINSLLSYFLWYGALVDDENEPVVPQILRQVLSVLLYLVAIAIIIQIIAPDSLNTFLATVGTSGAVAAFLAQEPIKQAFTALSLNITKRIRKGDFIEINGHRGRVEEIGWKSIRLTTFDESQLTIPNNILVNNIHYNHSRPNVDQFFTVEISVIEDVSPDKVIKLLTRTAWQLGCLSKAPRASLLELNEFRAKYELDVWIQDGDTDIERSNLLSMIWFMLRRENIHPVPYQGFQKNSTETAKLLFNQVPILEPLSVEEDDFLAKKAKWMHYGPKERVVIQGETDAALFIVAEGTLGVYINTEKLEEGQSTEHKRIGNKVATLSKNSIFGEIALLTGEARGATVVAESEVLLLKVSKDAIQPILAERPKIMEELSIKIAERQLDTQQELAGLSQKDMENERNSISKKLYGLMSNFFKE
jgi:small-conductance mechanosensitive channel